ncbi:hypothetical protein R3P38DRAFT_3209847 [Favolaschia claudopus]|uniref:Uncharacterized protein n=1 Tax=Favolaschia claudopus TaxID=2862362 RepID=A0AAW0AHN9_9AGAR
MQRAQHQRVHRSRRRRADPAPPSEPSPAHVLPSFIAPPPPDPPTHRMRISPTHPRAYSSLINFLSTSPLRQPIASCLLVLLLVIFFTPPLGIICSTFASSPSRRTPSTPPSPNYFGMYLASPYSTTISLTSSSPSMAHSRRPRLTPKNNERKR